MVKFRGSSLFTVLLFLLAVAPGCVVVGGGGGGGGPTPPSVDLTGSYDLTGFDIYYYYDYAGTLPASPFHLTEYDAYSWGGTMSIDFLAPSTGTIWQTISRDVALPVDWSGTFVVSGPGLFTVTVGSPFSLTVSPGLGYDLTTQNEMYYDAGLHLYFNEIDYWSKYSDYP